MSGKTIFTTEGGLGIAAGAPFTTFHYTIITSVPTPTIANGRLAQLADAVQSIIAPGLAAPDTFVLGQGAQDFVGGDRSVLIGKNVVQNNGGAGQAIDQVLIGNAIVVPPTANGSDQLIVIGNAITFTPACAKNKYGGTISIGGSINLRNAAAIECVNNVVIGTGAVVYGNANVVIGNAAIGGSPGVTPKRPRWVSKRMPKQIARRTVARPRRAPGIVLRSVRRPIPASWPAPATRSPSGRVGTHGAIMPSRSVRSTW